MNRCPSLSYDCDVDRVVKKPLLHHLFDLIGPPKCSPSAEAPPKVPNMNSSEFSILKYMDNNKLYLDRSSVCEDCEDIFSRISIADDSRTFISSKTTQSKERPKLIRWKSDFNASHSARTQHSTPKKLKHFLSSLNSTEKAMTKKSSSTKSPLRLTTRRRSVPTLKNELSGVLSVAEEISHGSHMPLNNNSSFYQLRKQLLSDYSIGGKYTHHSSWGSLSSLESIGKPSLMHHNVRPQHKYPSRCGDWVKTFPYNAATLHAGRNPLFLKNVVGELHKYKKACEKIFKENPDANNETLTSYAKKFLWSDHVLWMPKNG